MREQTCEIVSQRVKNDSTSAPTLNCTWILLAIYYDIMGFNKVLLHNTS